METEPLKEIKKITFGTDEEWEKLEQENKEILKTVNRIPSCLRPNK